jgi:peroxiredoxin Q/BCP
MAIQTGDVAPEFSLPTQEGKTFSLSAHRGHKILLWFFPEADTPG